MSSSKPLIWTIVLLYGALNATAFKGQNVPKGVNYKQATPEVNAKAKADLERALADPGTPKKFLSETISCGPILWKDLKDTQEAL